MRELPKLDPPGGCWRGRETLESAAAHAVVLAQVTIDRFDRMPGFLGHLVRLFSLDESLAADDSLVRERGAHVVQRRASWHELATRSFVCRQQVSNMTVVHTQQFRQIAVGKQSSLRVGLPAEPQDLL